MNVKQVDPSEITSNGGAVSSKAVGTAFIAVGCVTSGAWSLGSSIHTLVEAPLVTIGSLATAGALGGAGTYLRMKDEGKVTPSGQTVDVSATAA